MEDLAMPEVCYKLARMDQGLILVTGPTGHGKSTTMAAMIELQDLRDECARREAWRKSLSSH